MIPVLIIVIWDATVGFHIVMLSLESIIQGHSIIIINAYAFIFILLILNQISADIW